eukprot:CAMPEP_0195591634 /NCGR_PEP_ID=MMETSP0814-20130614/34744_1 /TAXON_ID=97485 /ORGANISM="Prymnesium parvum, Strain Texoma1" /LENGTH=83 /DNA_ID=CAMNT_0040730679 /DNA_START=822 /DNA_END=1073 /DNA_ORIENTATION=+
MVVRRFVDRCAIWHVHIPPAEIRTLAEQGEKLLVDMLRVPVHRTLHVIKRRGSAHFPLKRSRLKIHNHRIRSAPMYAQKADRP